MKAREMSLEELCTKLRAEHKPWCLEAARRLEHQEKFAEHMTTEFNHLNERLASLEATRVAPTIEELENRLEVLEREARIG
jgi:hypothetical protein